MKKTNLSNDLIGIAGTHFAVSELTLRRLVALPTVRNTAATDILVSELDGSAQANLQVKTSLKKVNFWPTPYPEKCLSGPLSFYVFLRYLLKEKRFEGFLETAFNVAEQVRKNLEDQKKRGRKPFSFWKLPSNEEETERLKTNWEIWRPPTPSYT